MAVNYTGSNRVMTSPDGMNWTAQTAAANNDWYSVTYGNGLFVAVSVDGTNRVMISSALNSDALDPARWTTGEPLSGSIDSHESPGT